MKAFAVSIIAGVFSYLSLFWTHIGNLNAIIYGVFVLLSLLSFFWYLEEVQRLERCSTVLEKRIALLECRLKMNRFRILSASHQDEKGTNYKKGDIVETEHDLVKMFPNKFEKT